MAPCWAQNQAQAQVAISLACWLLSSALTATTAMEPDVLPALLPTAASAPSNTAALPASLASTIGPEIFGQAAASTGRPAAPAAAVLSSVPANAPQDWTSLDVLSTPCPADYTLPSIPTKCRNFFSVGVELHSSLGKP